MGTLRKAQEETVWFSSGERSDFGRANLEDQRRVFAATWGIES